MMARPANRLLTNRAASRARDGGCSTPKKRSKNNGEIALPQKRQRIEQTERLASPIVRMLLQGVPIIGPASAIAIETALDEIAKRRMHIFFEELSEGNISITEADALSREFLHAWMSSLNYAIRERREEKTRLFADLFRGYCQNGRFEEDADIYEENLKILADLSYREFQILCVLCRFERADPESRTDFWEEFFDSLESELKIERQEIPAILQRLSRTGLYEISRGFLSPNDGIDRGKLTHNFYAFLGALKLEVNGS
jgi:DNA-binding MarR family transcriptional regulator